MKIKVFIRKELIEKSAKRLEDLFCDKQYFDTPENKRPIIQEEEKDEFSDLLGDAYTPIQSIVIEVHDNYSDKETLTERIWRNLATIESQSEYFSIGVGFTIMVRFE